LFVPSFCCIKDKKKTFPKTFQQKFFRALSAFCFYNAKQKLFATGLKMATRKKPEKIITL
jgi:hypothetical protein